MPEHLRARAFYNCRTRKEAYVKALGGGLSHPLKSFVVSLKPGECPRLVSTREGPRAAAGWSTIELNPFPGYVAALAVRDSSPEFQLCDWGA